MKKIEKKSEQENIKTVVFDYILSEVPDADSKSIRDLIKNIPKNGNNMQNWEDFVDEHNEVHEKIKDIIDKNADQNFEETEKNIKNNEEITDDLRINLDKFLFNKFINEEKNKLRNHLKKALNNIKSIDDIIDWSEIKKMKREEPEKLEEIFNLLENIYEKTKSNFYHINEIKEEDN